MNQLIAVALGGSFGAILRFLISSGVYQWLGRGFPYGTLAVNIIGSFLIGLLTEALILQRVALSMEYRSAILVGLFGSLTTFSTFSLDTLYLLEQGQFAKASLNVFVSVFVCIFVVWIGLTLGKVLFSSSNGSFSWMGWVFPHGLLVVNFIGAFLIGIVCMVLSNKVSLPVEQAIAIVVIIIGVFVTLSSLYLIHYFIEYGYVLDTHMKSLSVAIISNLVVCTGALWLGFFTAKQI
jgi:CrcB protein